MKIMSKKSIIAYKKAKKVIPGGVNSPVRAFRNVGSNPIFFKKGKGSKMYDIDGNKYIDCVGSWGPLILGHTDKSTLNSIINSAKNGTTFGAPTELETKMAEKIIEMVPSIEKVRMVSSGTEATMSAIRLARGYTKKSLIIKFSGNYHGHFDSFLIKAGSGAMTLGKPDSEGVTKNIAKDTLVAEYNNIKSVKKLFMENKDKIAGVIIEPIAGNMGLVAPKENFLNELRDLCSENDSLLIFDEVMTGFRVSKGGAQELYNIMPDITTLGKIIGGGLPAGAYGGKSQIMDFVAPDGPVYQAGTLSGNPLAMSAGLSVLEQLNDNLYRRLERISSKIENGINDNIKKLGFNANVARVGSMMTLFFTEKNYVRNFKDANQCNTNLYAKYFNHMLKMGIYLPPSQYECLFLSNKIGDTDIKKIIESNYKALKNLNK
ncbi:MAG: glutamate-1-semialdehyde-2,1-aminomutase [Flavobacteriales bacterium]|nr:glutamate-1-semialdehyde-2,1-aminomutase [Flavobacteriales bacterium]